MQKIIYVFILMVQTLTASNNFFIDLNQTISGNFYEQGIKALTLEKFETNTTQLKIKNDFEKLLPNYLTSTKITLFHDFDKLQMMIAIRRLFKMSSLYVNLTKEQNIFEKNLKDLNNIVKNSKDFDSYTVAINTYLKYYNNTNVKQKEFKTILESNPPPSSEIYFEKFEKRWTDITKQTLENLNKREPKTRDELKAHEIYTKTLSYYCNYYKNSYIESIKKKSPKEVEKWDNNITKEYEKLDGFLSRLKAFISAIYSYVKYSLFNIIDKDTYQLKFTCKRIAILTIRLHANIHSPYFQHEKILVKYKELIK